MTDTTKQRPLSPREEAMNAVAAARNADFTRETGIEITTTNDRVAVDPDIDPEHAAAEAERQRLEQAALAHQSGTDDPDAQQAALQQQQEDARVAAEEQAAQQAADATQRAQAAAGIDPNGKVKIRVNGKDIEITGEEAVRRLQKDVSADARLEQASATMREAERIRREAEEAQAALQQQQQAAVAKATGADGVVVDPATSKEFTAALFRGDADGAAEAFNKAVSSAVAAARADNTGRGQTATPVDPSVIAAQVRQQIAIDSALDRSRADYPDMYADPDIEAVAASKLERKVKGGQSFVEALGEVQSELATKFGWKKSGTPAATQTDRRDEKLARKAQLDPPGGALNVKTGSMQDPPQASVSDTIREIAKARGQTAVS